MTLRRLKIFVEVAESGKISDTARKLFITQASVSQSITEIEKEYNVQLFERYSKRLLLTPIGETLLEYAKMLLSYEKCIDDFLVQSTREKTLRVGASLSTGASILSQLILLMKEKNPNVTNNIVVSRNAHIENMLVNNELDIALNDIQPQNKDIICTPIMKDSLVLICSCSHPFFGKKSITLNELSGENLVIRDNLVARDISNAHPTRLEQLLYAHNIPYHVSWVCADTMASKKAVCDGHGVSTISRRLVSDDVAQGKLWALEILDANMDRTFNLIYHKDKYLTDHMISFIDLAKNFETLTTP